jgi:hypothetical protein
MFAPSIANKCLPACARRRGKAGVQAPDGALHLSEQALRSSAVAANDAGDGALSNDGSGVEVVHQKRVVTS